MHNSPTNETWVQHISFIWYGKTCSMVRWPPLSFDWHAIVRLSACLNVTVCVTTLNPKSCWRRATEWRTIHDIRHICACVAIIIIVAVWVCRIVLIIHHTHKPHVGAYVRWRYRDRNCVFNCGIGEYQLWMILSCSPNIDADVYNQDPIKRARAVRYIVIF